MGEKTIGLFRAIKPEWLNKTAELVIEGYDSTTIKAMLDDYLSYEIESSINRGKTRQLLNEYMGNARNHFTHGTQGGYSVFQKRQKR